MRLVTFVENGSAKVGILIGSTVVDAAHAASVAKCDAPASVRELLTWDAARRDELGEAASSSTDAAAQLDSLTLLAPVHDPQKIICLGLNYRRHAEEAGLAAPDHPWFFGKWTNSLLGHDQPVVLPPADVTFKVDYEGELAYVIGKPARCVDVADALDHVAGAMPFNDVSARDLSLANPLWTRGKDVDTFAPCGPALVTIDEIEDIQNLDLKTFVNGELRQHSNTNDQIFGVAETLSFLSQTMTLLPGDIVATGTPSGIGMVTERWLTEGDVVEVAIEGVGTLRNPIGAPSGEPNFGPLATSAVAS